MWKFPIPQQSAVSIAILFYAGDLEPRAKEKENRCTVKITTRQGFLGQILKGTNLFSRKHTISHKYK